MPAINLPESPLSACWKLMRDRLVADTPLVTAGVDFEFDEDRDATRDAGDVSPDTIRVFVAGGIGPWTWYSEHEHSCALLLRLRVVIRSLDFQDAANLTTAIHKALYDDANTDTFRESLQLAGAVTGQPRITRPLSPANLSKTNGMIEYLGEIALEVRTGIFGA